MTTPTLRTEPELVGNVDDLVANAGVAALVQGVQVAIFHLPQHGLFGLGNFDPFSEAAVLSRGVVGDVEGEPVVASPVYKQHFSLHTGRCVEDPRIRVPVYEVELRGEQVFVGGIRAASAA
ncbi:MAG: nitrite reductase small subunit NirD [Pseudomonadota bacterium]